MSEHPEEIEALQARIRDLEHQLDATTTQAFPVQGPARSHHFWRRVVVVVCLALAVLLAPLAVVAQWADDLVGSSERYVETVAPLASDAAVQAAITDKVTNEILTAIDLDKLTAEALNALAGQSFVPDGAASALPSLAVPLNSAIESFVHDRVEKVVDSPLFEQAWTEANRQAHEQMVAFLTGNTDGAVQVTNNAVSINISAFVAAAKKVLIDDGFAFAERIPTINATFTIFESADIGKAQKAFALLNTLALVLPVLVLLLIFVAVGVSPGRRRTWLAAGLGVAASMLLLGLTLNLIRPFYLDAVPTDVLPGPAAAAIYDALTHFIRVALRAVLVVALAVAVGAFLMAPTGAGAAIRGGISGGIRRLRRSADGAGLDTGPVGEFLGTYRTFVRTAIVSLGAVVYLLADHPTATTSILVLAAVVLLLALTEFIAVPPEEVPVEPAA